VFFTVYNELNIHRAQKTINMNHDDMLNIGAKFRAARQEKKMSLRELAARADVSPSLLSQIENGRANPSVMTLYNVAEALSVSITYFFPDSEETSVQPSVLRRTDTTASELRADYDSVFEALEQSSPKSPVITPASRLAIELKGGVRWERLTASEEQDIQFLEIQYQPGASSGSTMSHHSGREFGLILAGQLKLELGFEHYTLTPGDSIMFASTTPHRLSNEGTETVRAIWIVMNRGV
jgi:transcriptional regulator with XRE-family HTH domain